MTVRRSLIAFLLCSATAVDTAAYAAINDNNCNTATTVSETHLKQVSNSQPHSSATQNILIKDSPIPKSPHQEDQYQEIGKWDIRVGIGAGVRTNPLLDGDNIPLFIVPQISYNGARFFIQNLDVGFVLFESEAQQVNFLATPSYDQVFFDRWNPSNFFLESGGFLTAGTGNKEWQDSNLPIISIDDKNSLGPNSEHSVTRKMSKRRTAGLAGFEYSYTSNIVDIQVQYLQDFTRVHEGDEWRFVLSKYWTHGRHHFSAALGALWQSSDIINYYYGVSLEEMDQRGIYTAGSALTGLARIEWTYHLTPRWDLRLLSSYRALPNQISASPLLNKNKVVTVFVGGMYHF